MRSENEMREIIKNCEETIAIIGDDFAISERIWRDVLLWVLGEKNFDEM